MKNVWKKKYLHTQELSLAYDLYIIVVFEASSSESFSENKYRSLILQNTRFGSRLVHEATVRR